MSLSRRVGASSGALGLVVLSSCIGSDVVSPDVDPSLVPSSAVFDATTTAVQEFYILPPLVSGDPDPVGDFDPSLEPEIQACEISESELGPSGTMSCTGRTLVLEPGSLPFKVSVGEEHYLIAWDTDGPETGPIDTSEFLFLEILVAGQSLGGIQLDPQDPDGPGDSPFDAYAFHLGDELEVKFWIGSEALSLCDPNAVNVSECQTFLVTQDGGSFSLNDLGDRLAVFFEANSLPFFNEDGSLDLDASIALTLERIEAPEGEECIPGINAEGFFDAPLFGDSCFRLTSLPDLTDEFLNDVLVSICVDVSTLGGIDLLQDQQDQVTMVSYDDNGTPDDPTDDTWQALPDAAGDCTTEFGSLLDVPERGLMRYAALGINAFADFIGPQPVAAGDLRLGALTSSFSTISYTLPGQMTVTEGDGTVFLEDATETDVPVTIHVSDNEGLAVENATVHFETSHGTLDGSGTTFDGVSDANGDVMVTWTVDASTAGEKLLTASALGLLVGPVPPHNDSFLFTAESLEITATVCQPGSGLGTATVDGIFDQAEWACAGSESFTANVSGGSTDAEVHWMNDADNLYLAVRVQQSSLDKANDLRVDFDNDGDGAAAVGDDAIGHNSGSFIDEWLDQKCFDKSQSGCGTPDQVVNGSSALQNDGTWTVFELSHPLSGDANGEDFVRSVGEALGFTVTLQQGGKGAQGDTQWPGFRDYKIITIH